MRYHKAVMTRPFPVDPPGQEPDLHRPADRAAILRLLAFALLLGLLAYGYLVFNVALAIDQEVAGFATFDRDNWLAQGRWTTWLITVLLIRDPIMPIVPMSIAILGLAGSWAITSVTWRWPIGRAHYLAAPFAICFPVLVHLLIFLDLSFAIGIGELLGSLAIWLFAARRGVRRALAVMPLTLAIGCYQPLILYPLVSGLVLLALRVPASGYRTTLLRAAQLAALLLLALVAYYAIWQGLLWATGLSASYVDRFFHFDALLGSPGPILARTFGFAWSMLNGGADLYLEKRRVLAVTLLLAGALVVLGSRRACRCPADHVLLLAMVAAFIGTPLLVVAMNLGWLPYRTLIGVPVGFAGLAFMAGTVDRPRLAGPLLAILCALCLLGFVNASNRLLYLHALVVQADRDLAIRIIDRAYALGLPEGGAALPAEFVGAHALPPSPAFPRVSSSTLGASFFEWDGGNPRRITAFMRSMGLDLVPVSQGQRTALQPRIAAMPSWPASGSVQLLDGIVVVKFSDYSPQQRFRYGLAR
jgi:hypothetical protein